MKSTMKKKTKKRHGFKESERNGYRNLHLDFLAEGIVQFPLQTKKRHDFESSIRTEVTLFFEVQIISKLRLQLHSFAK